MFVLLAGVSVCTVSSIENGTKGVKAKKFELRSTASLNSNLISAVQLGLNQLGLFTLRRDNFEEDSGH